MWGLGCPVVVVHSSHTMVTRIFSGTAAGMCTTPYGTSQLAILVHGAPSERRPTAWLSNSRQPGGRTAQNGRPPSLGEAAELSAWSCGQAEEAPACQAADNALREAYAWLLHGAAAGQMKVHSMWSPTFSQTLQAASKRCLVLSTRDVCNSSAKA